MCLVRLRNAIGTGRSSARYRLRNSRTPDLVAGAALQRDGYEERATSGSTIRTPSRRLAQDDFTATPWLTPGTAASTAIASPVRLPSTHLALLRVNEPTRVRLSVGRGAFRRRRLEETEATGLSPLAPLGRLDAERADSFSADMTWADAPFEVTTTLFYSRIRGALAVRETGRVELPFEIVNLDGLTRTRGTEFIARYHREGELDIIVTHMFLWSTEPEVNGGGRREVPLNLSTWRLRHPAARRSRAGRIRVSPRQTIDENLLAPRISSCSAFSLIDHHASRVRECREPAFTPDEGTSRSSGLRDATGRWTVDAWALDGRTLNAGIRIARMLFSAAANECGRLLTCSIIAVGGAIEALDGMRFGSAARHAGHDEVIAGLQRGLRHPDHGSPRLSISSRQVCAVRPSFTSTTGGTTN
jgi:iron complex outermembrane receptor protein